MMKTLKFLLLFSLISFKLTAGVKYGNLPTDGYIGIGVIFCDVSTDAMEEIREDKMSDAYFFEKYTYDINKNHESINNSLKNLKFYHLTLRIPNIYGINSDSYIQLKDWIEKIEENYGIDVCEKITEVPNKKYPDDLTDACFTFTNAKIAMDQSGIYKERDEIYSTKIIAIVIPSSPEESEETSQK